MPSGSTPNKNRSAWPVLVKLQTMNGHPERCSTQYFIGRVKSASGRLLHLQAAGQHGLQGGGLPAGNFQRRFFRESRKWIKQERRLPGRRERCDRQRAVSLLLLITFPHPPLPCMVGLVFSLLQLRRGRVRSARSRASLLKRSQAVSTTIPRVPE